MRNKILVAYYSKTGFTKRYAEWIAAAVGGVPVDARQMTVKSMQGFDTVVFGGRCHAGTIAGWEKAKKQIQRSGPKNLVLFATGATPNRAADDIEAMWKRNLTQEELRRIPHFYFQSGLCYEKMSLPDRMMMKLFAAMLKKKTDKSEAEKEFENIITSSYDLSSVKYIEPLVKLLKEGI